MNRSTILFGVVTLVALVIAMGCAPAHAEVTGGIGTGMLFSYGSDGRTLETVNPMSARGGYNFDFGEVSLEYSRISQATGASYVTVNEVSNQLLVWYRKVLTQSWVIAPFLAAGGGAQMDQVQTQFQNEISKDSGGAQAVWAVAAGFAAPLTANVNLQFEGRAETSPSDRPNPELGIMLRLGFSI